ncbi:MAG: hypothetical protein Rubg2KO_32970 [Rubricoccaceae bacterium]
MGMEPTCGLSIWRKVAEAFVRRGSSWWKRECRDLLVATIGYVPYCLEALTETKMCRLVVFLVCIVSLSAMVDAQEQSGLVLLPNQAADHWSYDVQAGGSRWTSPTGPAYQVEWVAAGVERGEGGSDVYLYDLITRANNGTFIRSCSYQLIELEPTPNNPSARTLIRAVEDPFWSCTASQGAPMHRYFDAVIADVGAASSESFSVGGDPLSTMVVHAERSVGFSSSPGSGAEVTVKVNARYAEDLGLIDYHFRHGLGGSSDEGYEYWRSTLVGATVGGQTYGQPRRGELSEPSEVWGLSVGSEWVYEVSRWVGDRDTASVDVQQEQWVVSGGADGSYQIDITSEGTSRSCTATVDSIGEVSAMSLIGETCPVYDSLYRHLLPYPTPPDELSYHSVRSSYLTVPGDDEPLDFGGVATTANQSHGEFYGWKEPDTWASTIGVEYSVARGIGLHTIRRAEPFHGNFSDRRTTVVERRLLYAKVGGQEYGTATAGQAEEVGILKISMGPNPAKQVVSVWLIAEPAHERVALTVIDVLGRVVYQAHTRAGDSLQLDVSQFPSGLYIVSAESGRQRVQTRLVVAH